jgi:hypothetical protein
MVVNVHMKLLNGARIVLESKGTFTMDIMQSEPSPQTHIYYQEMRETSPQKHETVFLPQQTMILNNNFTWLQSS